MTQTYTWVRLFWNPAACLKIEMWGALKSTTVREVGRKEKVPVLDVFTLLWEASGKVEEKLDEFLCDGLHLSEAGYDVCISYLLYASPV